MRVLLPVHQISGGHELIALASQAGADLTLGCFTRDALGKGFQAEPERRHAPSQLAHRGGRRLG